MIITFAVITGAVILVLRATPQHKIHTQLKSDTYRWDKDGTPIPYMKTANLKNLLSGGIFDVYTEQAWLKSNAPEINIATTRQGNQLTAAIFWPDPAEGKKILAGYIKFLNKTDRNNSSQTSGLQNQRNSLKKSIKPIKPNKKKIVALAGVLEVFLAILCTYCCHFWLMNKEKLTQDTIDA